MMRAIVFLGGCILLLRQFQVTGGLYGGIDTSNYFALLLGTMVAIGMMIVALMKASKILYWGDTVVFDAVNFRLYQLVIEYETGEKLGVNAQHQLTLGGNPIDSYTFQGDYYFFCGDQVLNSNDSRYWVASRRNLLSVWLLASRTPVIKKAENFVGIGC